MSYCINPNCPKPENLGTIMFCTACGSDLLLEGCYRVTRLLSDRNKPSGFGTIYEVSDGGKVKILKVLHNNHPKAIELFQQEAEVLKHLKHPGIPGVETDGYFQFPISDGMVLHCLVMEKIEGMNLEEWLKTRKLQPITERAALRWLKQLIEILHQVHQQNYFHRDIKPANIMLRPDGQLALVDFGTAREVSQTFLQKLAGQQVTGIISAGYTPMEQVNGKAVPQSDFFALGRTFVYLLTGKSPLAFPENPQTGDLIWRSDAPQISAAFADLIDYLMQPFPAKRPQNTQEICQRLQAIEQNLPYSESTTQNLDNPAISNKSNFDSQTEAETIVTHTLTNSSNRKKSSGLKLLVGGGILLLGCASLIYGIQSNRNQISSKISVEIASQATPNQAIKSPADLSIPPVNTQPQDTDKQSSTNAPANTISTPSPIAKLHCTIEVADPQDTTLNVRSQPNKDSEKVGELPNGTKISVIKNQQGWYQINYPLNGWVAANRTRQICVR
ncbi:serine/threonine protein kinase [Calothrix sp. UHCC 0171]|uniref:serine/threonine protein kinase n=1 Tax=Calothrix sp. UHCC 0171 TaxID=3110245 RepID=UPI002B1FAC52|nr:serine/threonine protein kinase [Calothrix sp. UHCC 0171]MEA5570946.1 serine/threonine protein kinase [Calothrix sp. UHCC 0171]